ncbi:hypothetical protein FE783_35350 [Paenibacillus mesophilus]|nr:hypothetical protein FE783_35350 [Paenibacillus mesophilus]
MLRTYKYCLYPTTEQQEKIEFHTKSSGSDGAFEEGRGYESR